MATALGITQTVDDEDDEYLLALAAMRRPEVAEAMAKCLMTAAEPDDQRYLKIAGAMVSFAEDCRRLLAKNIRPPADEWKKVAGFAVTFERLWKLMLRAENASGIRAAFEGWFVWMRIQDKAEKEKNRNDRGAIPRTIRRGPAVDPQAALRSV